MQKVALPVLGIQVGNSPQFADGQARRCYLNTGGGTSTTAGGTDILSGTLPTIVIFALTNHENVIWRGAQRDDGSYNMAWRPTTNDDDRSHHLTSWSVRTFQQNASASDYQGKSAVFSTTEQPEGMQLLGPSIEPVS